MTRTRRPLIPSEIVFKNPCQSINEPVLPCFSSLCWQRPSQSLDNCFSISVQLLRCRGMTLLLHAQIDQNPVWVWEGFNRNSIACLMGRSYCLLPMRSSSSALLSSQMWPSCRAGRTTHHNLSHPGCMLQSRKKRQCYSISTVHHRCAVE